MTDLTRRKKELLPEFRKGEVSRDEVTFYEDKKDE